MENQKKNNLLLVKSNFEGLATAILLNVILEKDLDIRFYKYDAVITKQDLDDDYKKTFISDLRLVSNIKDNSITQTFGLKGMNIYLSLIYTEQVMKYEKELTIFMQHCLAYIDWSWQKKELYYGKNIDELSKHFSKQYLIDLITNRILEHENIIKDSDIQLILFSKKLITHYINDKQYNIIENNNIKIDYNFCDIYEIELANKILNNEPDIDIVILANLNTKIIRIKPRDKDAFKDEILNMNGYINSNGGTIKISDETINQINDLIFNNIINKLTEKGRIDNG